MPYELSRRKFHHTLATYRPSAFEQFGQADARFVKPMHHALKSRERLYAALKTGMRLLPESAGTIVDLGPYPGSLLRLLRVLLPDAKLRLVGAGLMASPEFVRCMKEDCDAEIRGVNLDPMNPQFRAKGYPDAVPVPDGHACLAFALEIIEHLSSPFHLLREARRILAPGGHLVITTPNVTRIGNVFKLLVGHSPNDRLGPPGYFNPEDEWQPHVREYAMDELADLLRQCGFEVAERRMFLGEDTRDCVQPARQRLIDLAKVPFYLIPHLRGSLLIVGRKPG